MKVKKLVLNKETIAHLGGNLMQNARGGALPDTNETVCICLSAGCADSANCHAPILTMNFCIKTQLLTHCFDNSDFCGTIDIYQCQTDISFCPMETDCGGIVKARCA